LELENDIIDPTLAQLGAASLMLREAGRKSYAFYAETRIPLFSPEMGIIGLHSVEVTTAFRFEEFLNNSTNALVPKVGVRWAPIDEQLTLRSTWGEGFSEPSLFQLYGLANSAVIPIRFNNVSEPEARVVTASNPKLQPQDSRSWTGGAVYSPKWMPWGQLTVSIDLWDIERSGVAAVPSVQEVLRRFIRPGPLLPGEDVGIDPTNGSINFIRTNFQNTGRQNARGADLGALYQITTHYGIFTMLSDWAYLDQFIFQPTAGSKGRNTVAQVSDNLGGDGWYRWRGTTRLDWTWHDFDLIATWRYIGGFREIIKNSTGAPSVNRGFDNLIHEHWTNPTNFIDVQAGYDLIFTPPVEEKPVAGYSKGGKEVMTAKDGKAIESTAAYSMPCWKMILNNSTITIGCNNIFGQDPPKMFGLFFGDAIRYPGFEYDNIGRFWYIEVKKKF
jgi:TonB-dependent receptor-like protein